MSSLYYKKEDIEAIKSMLRDRLGIQYALPDYVKSRGRKVHIMFDEEVVKSQYPGMDIAADYTVNAIDPSSDGVYSSLPYDAKETSSAVEGKEESTDNPNCLTPKEDIYQIITDLMKDDDPCDEDKDKEKETSSFVPPKNLRELVQMLYSVTDAPSLADAEVLVFHGSQAEKTDLSQLPSLFPTFLSRPIHSNHPNLLPMTCILRAKQTIFTVSEHFPYTLATVLKYNRHLVQLDDGSIAIQQFIFYQLLQAVAFLHARGVCVPQLTPDTLVLTENLWLFLPLSSLLAPVVPRGLAESPLEAMTLAWVNGRLSNFDYVMCLNEAAGRRMDDSNFHSIMPWVCDFSSETAGWRDFTISKFRMNKGDNQLDVTFQHSVPKHHLSESLSELTYAIYMARRMPVSLLKTVVRSNFQAKEYPGNMKRLFEWTPDECIPEYYTDPSVFVSIHDSMDDMELPPWCPTPAEFVAWHRGMLENDYVSRHLHLWINLNFGYQLSGQAAIDAKNVPLKQEGVSGLTKNPGFVQLFTVPPPQRMKNARGEDIFEQVDVTPRHISHLPASHLRHATDDPSSLSMESSEVVDVSSQSMHPVESLQSIHSVPSSQSIPPMGLAQLSHSTTGRLSRSRRNSAETQPRKESRRTS